MEIDLNNASFGEFNERNNSQNGNEPEGNINLNNLSFDANNNIEDEPNFGTQNAQILSQEEQNLSPKQEDQNEIFDQIPIEIESEEKAQKNFYTRKLIQEEIEFLLGNMVSLIESAVLTQNSGIFSRLKLLSTKSYNKLAKAEILYLNIESSLRKILKIYRRNRAFSLTNALYLWSFKARVLSGILLIDKEMESTYKKEQDEKLRKANQRLREIEESYKKSEKNYNNLQKFDGDLKRRLIEYKDKEKKSSQRKAELEQRLKFLSENFQRDRSSSGHETRNYENKIQNLEKKIDKIKKENEQRQIKFEEFYGQMNEMLQFYERNYEQEMINLNISNPSITLSQNNFSPKDRPGNKTCYTSGDLSKNNNNSVRNNYSTGKK